ncbi:MAG: hypothetical protein IKA62_06750 [Clostridia bacterium]|nr:hypothetical protein [Clostridia bacterium]
MSEKAYESFVNPDKIYHGTDFWMLNDKLEADEIVRQLHEMKKQGVYTFIARTYIGLKSDYPGPEFQSKLRVIVDTATRLNMKLFLQAGYMPEDVTGLPREYALNYIKVYREGDEIPEDERVLIKHNEFIFTEWNSAIFLDMFNRDSMEFYIKQSYEEVWRDFALDFGKAIISVWVDEPSYKAEHLPFPRGIEERFLERWGYPLIENLPKLFFDIDGYKTLRYHYRKLLQDLLEENYFKSVREWCNAHGLMASGHLMLEDRLGLQIARAGATMPFYKYFDIPGIDVLQGQQNWKRGELKPAYGGDYTYRDTMMNTPIQCASAARQIGSEHILCEMYALTSQNMTFRMQKYMFDYLASHGINHRSVHGIFYSLKGRSKRVYPPHINYYQPYWNDVHIMNDYVAAVSRFISIGKPEGEAVVIHPLDSAFCEYTCFADSKITGLQPSRVNLAKRDANFLNMTTSLSLSGCIFDYGDERSIERDGSVEGGLFYIGKMSYDTVVIPDLIEIQKSTLDKIREFASQGGRVVVLGGAPTMLDGIETSRNLLCDIENVIYVDGLSQLTSLLQTKKYSIFCEEENRNIMVRRRVDGMNAYYYIFNADGKEEKHIVLTINGSVKAEIWNPFDKSRKSLECTYNNCKTEIEITLAAGGNALVYTEEIKDVVSTNEKSAKMTLTMPLKSEFEVERKHKNVLLMEYCSYKKGDGEFTCEYPVVAVQQQLVEQNYTGELTQKYTFYSELEIEGLELALEDAEQHRIFLNGEEVEVNVNGYYWAKAFQKVAMPKSRIGLNVIELKRHYVPLAKIRRKISSLFENRLGVELEAVYLLGDFSVKMNQEPTRNGALRYSRLDIKLTDEEKQVAGELTKAGYPFYAGSIALTRKFEWKGNTDGLKIALDELDACICHVKVNGIDCGSMHTYPFELDISAAVKDGENTVTLEIVNTLRNLLGPWHRPQGEVGNIRSAYEEPDIAWMGVATKGDNTWYDNRVPDTNFWTDSYMLTPLGIRGLKLKKDI